MLPVTNSSVAGRLCLLCCAFFLAAGVGRAEVKLPAIFGSHMVLQQESKIPVWGTAEPGEAVTVTLGDHTSKTTADAKGKWQANLEPMPTNSTPLTLTVAGKNSLVFDDVLVGDVWICSGQSNMEFALSGARSFGGAANQATAVPAANDPQLRLFIVKHKVSLEPEANVTGEWKVCTPDSAGLFSAVGYFFGQELRKTLQRPVGLIGTYWGGMPAQAFTSLKGLQKEPPFTHYVAEYQKMVANLPAAQAAFPAALADFQAKLQAWNASDDGKGYQVTIQNWKQGMASGKPVTRGPGAPASQPKPPQAPEGPPNTPTVLFNGMIAPLMPLAIKGTIWYQGESNADNAAEYRTLFPRMIVDWREAWHEGDFPFLFVQLASFKEPQKEPSEGGWAYLREAQLDALSLPNTGMAVTIDLGAPRDIHPKDKLDVGLRLAQAAKHVAYHQDVVYSGPIYRSMKVEGNTIRLSFQQTGSGLQMSVPPWTFDGVAPRTPSELTGFAVAGADKKWHWAKAKIDGISVVVSSDAVAAPVAVRYGWANDPACNLYNKEGLPASPFRTDDWVDDAPPLPAALPVAGQGAKH